MHGNRLPRPVRLRTRHSADDAQIPEHIRHIAARPAPHTYGCGTDDARSVHARRERRDAGRNALRKRPGLRQRSAHRPRNGTRVRLLSRRRGAIRSDRFPSDHRLQETVPRRNPRRLCRQTRIPTTLRRDNGTGYRAVAYGGRLGPHGRRGESGRQGDLCDHRPHAGRGSPRTDPQGTDQISRSYAYLEPGLRKGLYGTACLRSIAPAAHIGHAAFYGLLARLDGLRPET